MPENFGVFHKRIGDQVVTAVASTSADAVSYLFDGWTPAAEPPQPTQSATSSPEPGTSGTDAATTNGATTNGATTDAATTADAPQPPEEASSKTPKSADKR